MMNKVIHTPLYLPPEWAPQSAVMLTWPHDQTIWADTLDEADKTFANIAAIISHYQKVIITCRDEAREQHIRTLLKAAKANITSIHITHAMSDDVWVRDHGPITVLQKDGAPLLLDFIFNGWGNKYPADHDNKITKILHEKKSFGTTEHMPIQLVLEGGAIEVDGKGTMLSTTSCLLSKNRNSNLNQQQIEGVLAELFHIKKFLWLNHGALAGDDTDGHIDTLARFTDAETICYITCDDESDEHFVSLKAMEAELKTFTNYQSKPYRLIPLPWPRARFADYDGRRLPATYANFLIINDAVLVPTYNDPADEQAVKTIASCFPNRKTLPVPSLPIIQWYGSLHCMTMQLPKGVV